MCFKHLDLYKTGVFSLEGGLGTIANSQLSKNIRHMILYCAFGEEKRGGDLAIAGALRNEAEYLKFAFGEGLNR